MKLLYLFIVMCGVFFIIRPIDPNYVLFDTVGRACGIFNIIYFGSRLFKMTKPKMRWYSEFVVVEFAGRKAVKEYKFKTLEDMNKKLIKLGEPPLAFPFTCLDRV